MDIRDYKRAEIDLKILERDRRAEIVEWKRVKGEWARDDAILNKHRRALDSKKRQIDQQEIDDTGHYEKQKVGFENTMEFSPYMKVKRFLDEQYPEYASSLLDSISDGQYESKKWMSEILKYWKFGSKEPWKIEIAGSWFGWPFIELLDDAIVKIDSIDLYDIDEVCHEVVRKYIYHFKPKYKINQYHDFFERGDKRIRHMIICTSCEHMPDIATMKEYYKDTPKPVLALQSNDYTNLKEHENCVENYTELAQKNEIKNILYQGEKDFGYYKRFMIIGTW